MVAVHEDLAFEDEAVKVSGTYGCSRCTDAARARIGRRLCKEHGEAERDRQNSGCFAAVALAVASPWCDGGTQQLSAGACRATCFVL